VINVGGGYILRIMRTQPRSLTGAAGEAGYLRPEPFLVLALAPGTPHRLTPSIRIPVTPGNRDLLRRLRAAELEAWQKDGIS
jgi:hypothetical protein